MLVGIGLVVVAACGGAIALIGTSMAGLARMIEEREGPLEHVDEDYRVRVQLPQGQGWELLAGELASSWDPAAIVVVHPRLGCSGGVLVTPAPGAASLGARLDVLYPDGTRRVEGVHVEGLPGTAVDLVDAEDDSVFGTAFLHEGVLYRLVGDGNCLPSLRAGFELLPGRVAPRRVRAPMDEATGRAYRIHHRVFQSAISGLVVDATEPFAPIVDGASQLVPTAEIVVVHENGTEIGLDPFFRGSPGTSRSPEAPSGQTFDLAMGEQTIHFERQEGPRYEVFGEASLGDLSMYVLARGADAASVREALEALGPRLGHLDPEGLALLRSEIGIIHDRRAGRDWSLRDGNFREHAFEPRPTVAVYVPAWTSVVAGRELAARSEDPTQPPPQLALLERRDLGVSVELTVEPTGASDAVAALEQQLAELGQRHLERHAPSDEVRVGRARADVSYDLDDATRNRMTVVTQVQGGWLFRLAAWRREPEHPGAAAFVDQVVEGFVIEPPSPPRDDERRHRDERLGFVLHGRGAEIEAGDFDPELFYLDALARACALGENEDLCLIASSDVTAADALLDALDLVETERTVGAIWSLPATATTLDERPASERSFWEGSQEVHVVTTTIDRTVYVAVGRGSGRTDWTALFDRIDLDP